MLYALYAHHRQLDSGRTPKHAVSIGDSIGYWVTLELGGEGHGKVDFDKIKVIYTLSFFVK